MGGSRLLRRKRIVRPFAKAVILCPLLHGATPYREGLMTIHIRRREFIGALGSTAAAWPLVALAQQATMPVIGVLSSSLPNAWAIRRRAFHQGLKEQGYPGTERARVYRGSERRCR